MTKSPISRDGSYVGGGEEYLTFSGCTVNAGGAMDHKAGVFTAPVSGKTLKIAKNFIK